MAESRVDLAEFEGADLKALAVIVVLLKRALPEAQHDFAIERIADVINSFDTLADLQAFIAALDLLAAHPRRRAMVAYLKQADALVAIGDQVM